MATTTMSKTEIAKTEMTNAQIFALAWGIFFISVTLLLLAATILLTVYGIGFGFALNSLFLLLLIPVIAGVTIAVVKKVTPPMYEDLYEWNGRVMEPFEPGPHYPFPWFGFLKPKGRMPMNMQFVHVLSGDRTGLPPKTVAKYQFGGQTNVEIGRGVKTGGFVRLYYSIGLKIVDSIKAAYVQKDLYKYIAGIIEERVNTHALSESPEEFSSTFYDAAWSEKIINNAKGDILKNLGVELSVLIPGDIINTPEVEKARQDVEVERRRKGTLDEKLINMKVEKDIAHEQHLIAVDFIKKVKETSGASGDTLVSLLARQMTLDAVIEATKNGHLAYMDGSEGKGLMNSIAIGVGIQSGLGGSKSDSKKDDSDKDESKKDDGSKNKNKKR